MTTTGLITLYHQGQQIAYGQYASPSKRALIIDGWKKLYGPAFEKAEIIDTPDPPGQIFQASQFKKGELIEKGKINRGVRKVYPAERGAKNT